MKHSALTNAFCLSVVAQARAMQCPDLNHFPGLGLSEGVHYNASIVGIGELNVGTVAINQVEVCRVVGSIDYGKSGNHTLNFELWLPERTKYNGRYVAMGNGGFGAHIDYVGMMTNLNQGYAVAGGDSGHPVTENGDPQPGQPGSYVAFFHDRSETLSWMQDSIAMFTKPSRILSATYYGRPPVKMYYYGCSTGGGQGFALAQHYPDLFDGIFAGSPANWYSHVILSFLWNGLNSGKEDSFLSQDALDLITGTIIDKCDDLDHVKDGVLADPTQCSFDIATLQCAACQSPVVDNKTTCLTKSQVENARKFYAGPANPSTGRPLYPGFALGSESTWIRQETSLFLNFSVPILQNLVFQNLSYDYTTFNWDSDAKLVDKMASPLIDNISPNLEAFRKSGGKMIVTQGWADPLMSPFWPIQHREQMRGISGKNLDSFFSLFMIPGFGHCGSSPPYPHVPSTFNTLERLVAWVEHGSVPGDIVGTNPADGSNATMTVLQYPRA